MHEISFRKPPTEDALRISLLFKQVYLQTYAKEGISHEFANFISKKFSPEAVAQNIERSDQSLLIAYFKDNPVGIAQVIHKSRCPIGNVEMPELDKLYVLERFHGKSIGHVLLKEIEKLVVRSGYKEICLEVYSKNPRAIAFYESKGYSTIGTVDFVMETNTYENFVMTKKLV